MSAKALVVPPIARARRASTPQTPARRCLSPRCAPMDDETLSPRGRALIQAATAALDTEPAAAIRALEEACVVDPERASISAAVFALRGAATMATIAELSSGWLHPLYAAAESDLMVAVDLAPREPYPQDRLAVLYERTGRARRARAYRLRAAQLKGAISARA